MLKSFDKLLQLLLALTAAYLFTLQPAAAQKWPDYAKNGMVVSTNQIGSDVGRDILKKGGNAIDAAVATGFALAVVHPSAGNIGGGGFMVIYFADGSCQTVDYREKAPMAAHPEMYLDENKQLRKNSNHNGYLAVGVPGSVAGLLTALEKWGTMTPAEVLAPAIELAEKGFPLSYGLARSFQYLEKRFSEYPGSVKSFMKADGSSYQMGDLWRQPDLAATLNRIADKGRDGFYAGKTAEIFEREMKKNGGLITRADLAAYQAVIRKPVSSNYRGHTLYAMAPPSSGGITVSIMLNILEKYDLPAMGHNSAAYIHTVSEAMRRAFEQRARYLGDPDFNPDMPVDKLLSKPFAARLAASIQPDMASNSNPQSIHQVQESEETTHYSVIDKHGNAVSNTYTLEYSYGSKIVLDGAGFLLNNEMGDFNPVPGYTDSTGLIGTRPNLVAPQKRMLSSMTPSILVKDGKPLLIIGSPGGRTIINTVLQCILNVVDFKMNVFEAINAPRFHHQWLPNYIYRENKGFSKDTEKILMEKGHRLRYRGTQGRAMGIYVDPQSGIRSGAADPRSPDGGVAGY